MGGNRMSNKLQRFKNGEIVLHTPTQAELMRWCEKEGLEWKNGDYWRKKREDTYVDFCSSGLSYSDISYRTSTARKPMETLTEQDFEFTLDYLQTGMVVEMRDGDKMMVLRGDFTTDRYGKQRIVFHNDYSFSLGGNYSSDLTNNKYRKCDIVKVYKPNMAGMQNTFKDCSDKNLIWSRESQEKQRLRETIETLKIQLADAEKKLEGIA